MDWISSLDEQDLENNVIRAAGSSRLTMNIDDLGWELTSDISPNQLGSGVGDDLWDKIKTEFSTLVCGSGGPYRDVRKKAAEMSSSGQAAIIAVVAEGLGHTFGISAIAITPVISLLLLALLRIGREIYCNDAELSIPLPPKASRKSGRL